MRSIIFEHITDEWYDGDNPNALDNYDFNRVKLDLSDGYWEKILYSFIRFLNTSGFRNYEGKPITEANIINELGGTTQEEVEKLYLKSKEAPSVYPLSPGVSAWEYDG